MSIAERLDIIEEIWQSLSITTLIKCRHQIGIETL